MRSLERVNIRTNERTYVLTYIRTGQILYPLHNFVVRGDNKSEQSKTLLKTVSKAYKNTMSINVQRHKNEKTEKLRRIKSSNPKEFWRILNDENCNHASAAPLNDLYNFFKNINIKTTYTQTDNINEDKRTAHLSK